MNGARVGGGGDGAEVARSEIGADPSVLRVSDPLRVIPHVEELRAELEIGAALLREKEVLEDGKIPVVMAGATDEVLRRGKMIAISLAIESMAERGRPSSSV